MSRVIKAPTTWYPEPGERTVFLAGSIDMGAAEDWQTRATNALLELPNVLVLNPRRDDWDSSWVQSIEHEQFRVQVEWELDGLERADVVLVNFCPGLRAPITLLELGLVSQRKADQVVVHCPEGFWRKGNVDILCLRYVVRQVGSLEGLLGAAASMLVRR